LYNGLENGNTNLAVLPTEIAAQIASYNLPDFVPQPSTKTWFDDMVELIRWDNHGFKPNLH